MDLLQHPSAVNGLFVDEDPATGREATVITAPHQNALQQEIVNAIVAAGLSPDAANVSQLSQAIQLLGGGGSTTRNMILNGGMRVAQRGFSIDVNALPRYTLDRWQATADSAGGSGTGRVSRVGLSTVQEDVPGARLFMRYEQLAAPTGGSGYVQTKLEEFASTSGETVTFSFYARAEAPTQVPVLLIQETANTGTATPTQTVDLTTSWQRFSVQFTLPSVLGAALGGPPVLVARIGMPTQSGAIVEITHAQLEIGAEASAYTERPIDFERLLCARYFEKSAGIESGLAPGVLGPRGRDVGDQILSLQSRFRVPKRVTPTVTFYGQSGAPGTIRRFAGGGAAGQNVNVQGVNGTTTDWTGVPVLVSDVTIDDIVRADWTADAEL